MGKPKLAIGYCTDANLGTGGALFLMSLTNTIDVDWAGPRRIEGRRIHVLAGGGGIDQARNDIARQFLAMDADWLLTVDADMVWKPATLERLLAAADPMARPILGALCFGARYDDNNIFPAMLMDDGQGGLERYENYPRNQIVRVTATGAAFMLVHRRVFEHMAAHFPPNRPKVFYAISYLPNGERIGEDVHWCLQAGRLGFPIQVHTGIQVDHAKNSLVNEASYDQGAKQQVRRRRAEMKVAR